MSTLDRLLVVAALAAGLWWALSRTRRPRALQWLSAAVVALGVTDVAVADPHWQMVPWQVLALSVGTAAALRRWRPGHSHRSMRVIGRGALGVGLLIGGVALLTAFVPTLPGPSGPHHVASEIFRWTDPARAETLTRDPSDRRQVIAQAWYPTDTPTGRAVPYFEAQDELPSSVAGLPSFMYASFGRVNTHATFDSPVSPARRSWPVLIFSPGLSVPREAYTALCADLASRGFVVVALSTPYESAPTVLRGGQVAGQTAHPDVMGPAPHPELERLIDIRAADTSFVLDRLAALDKTDQGSPLVGHLDMNRVGMVGHSLGGATAVQTMAADPRIKVGVNIDGKLFGSQPDARLKRPLLWIQSDAPRTSEYTQGRDRLLKELRGGGTVVTVDDSAHMSFSDSPAYWTAAGRKLLGDIAGAGSVSTATMTSVTGDTISAFVAHAMGVARTPTPNEVLAQHIVLPRDHQVAAKTATSHAAHGSS